jgi:hypothetical protein
MGLSLQKNKTLATCYNEHVTRCSRKYEKVSWPRVINTRLQLATCIIDTSPISHVYDRHISN